MKRINREGKNSWQYYHHYTPPNIDSNESTEPCCKSLASDTSKLRGNMKEKVDSVEKQTIKMKRENTFPKTADKKKREDKIFAEK